MGQKEHNLKVDHVADLLGFQSGFWHCESSSSPDLFSWTSLRFDEKVMRSTSLVYMQRWKWNLYVVSQRIHFFPSRFLMREFFTGAEIALRCWEQVVFWTDIIQVNPVWRDCACDESSSGRLQWSALLFSCIEAAQRLRRTLGLCELYAIRSPFLRPFEFRKKQTCLTFQGRLGSHYASLCYWSIMSKLKGIQLHTGGFWVHPAVFTGIFVVALNHGWKWMLTRIMVL